MKAHESQDKSSQFTAKFKEIQDEIDSLINLIQNVVSERQIMSQYNTKILVKIFSTSVHWFFSLTVFSCIFTNCPSGLVYLEKQWKV